jgi:hypothetical protein
VTAYLSPLTPHSPHGAIEDVRRGEAGGRTPSGNPDDPRRRATFYRVVAAQDGSWSVLGCPWLSIAANDRRSAVDATRAAVAAWLAVEPDAFDVESA